MNVNPYSLPEPWDLVAGGYAETTMKFLGQYASEAVDRAALTPNSTVLDVACGPGTLPLMISSRVRHVDAIDFAPNMIALLKKEIEARKLTNIEPRWGDAQSLPYPDNRFDAAFSMFGLMFFPDRKKGFGELYRSLQPGGKALVTSWAPVSRSPVMQVMFEAIQKITGDTAPPKRAMATLEDPEVFRAEMTAAGFRYVEIIPLTKPFTYTTVEGFWADMVKGSAPIVVLRQQLGEKVWREKEKFAIQFLQDKLKPNHTPLTSDAWLGFGIK